MKNQQKQKPKHLTYDTKPKSKRRSKMLTSIEAEKLMKFAKNLPHSTKINITNPKPAMQIFKQNLTECRHRLRKNKHPGQTKEPYTFPLSQHKTGPPFLCGKNSGAVAVWLHRAARTNRLHLFQGNMQLAAAAVLTNAARLRHGKKK